MPRGRSIQFVEGGNGSVATPVFLREPLKVAAPKLGTTQSQITTAALHAFLSQRGF